MDYFKNKFLSQIGKAELEKTANFVCGDCKYFKKSKCPTGVEYKLANTCYFYKPSKKQRKFLKSIQDKKTKKVQSMTVAEREKKVRARKKKNSKEPSKRAFTKDGFVRGNLQFGFKIKTYLEKLIEDNGWKCQRKRCKDRKPFVVKAEHPTRKSVGVREDLIYRITDTYIDFKLVCPGCTFLHNFPTDVAKEIRASVKEIKESNIFEPPETEEEAQLLTQYVSQIVFPDGFEGDPLISTYKGTIAYKAMKRKIRKVSKQNDIKPSKVIGIVFNRTKGCLVLDNATFVVVPGSVFNFAA